MKKNNSWLSDRLIVASRTSHIPIDIEFELLEKFVRENIRTNNSLMEYLLSYCSVTRQYKALLGLQDLLVNLKEGLKEGISEKVRHEYEKTIEMIETVTIPHLEKIVKYSLGAFNDLEHGLMGIRSTPIGWQMLGLVPRYSRAYLNMLIRDLEAKLQEDEYTKFIERHKEQKGT